MNAKEYAHGTERTVDLWCDLLDRRILHEKYSYSEENWCCSIIGNGIGILHNICLEGKYSSLFCSFLRFLALVSCTLPYLSKCLSWITPYLIVDQPDSVRRTTLHCPLSWIAFLMVQEYRGREKCRTYKFPPLGLTTDTPIQLIVIHTLVFSRRWCLCIVLSILITSAILQKPKLRGWK